METSSALLAFCGGNSPVTGEFPSQRPVTRTFDVFFDLHLNKRFSKQSRRWWFETQSRQLWRHWDGNEFHWKGTHPTTPVTFSVSSPCSLHFSTVSCSFSSFRPVNASLAPHLASSTAHALPIDPLAPEERGKWVGNPLVKLLPYLSGVVYVMKHEASLLRMLWWPP